MGALPVVGLVGRLLSCESVGRNTVQQSVGWWPGPCGRGLMATRLYGPGQKVLDGQKLCTKCRTLKSIYNFSKKKDQLTNLNCWCKPCCTQNARQWRKKYPGKYRAQMASWVRAHPKQRRAIDQLNYAVQHGRLKRPKECEQCRRESTTIQGHHHLGYDHPLQVVWLCRPCHEHAHHGGTNGQLSTKAHVNQV